MSMALASVPQGASGLPASAVPTVLERFPGFVRCVMDIAPEVVGWVIGRSGAHIKEMKVRCAVRLVLSFFSFTCDTQVSMTRRYHAYLLIVCLLVYACAVHNAVCIVCE